MSTQFHPLIIKNIIKETSDCVSVVLALPEGADQTKWNFSEGQYLTFKKDINGEELRRSYSICAAPYEQKLKVAIKKVEGGKFSTYANEHLNIGDILDTMPPMGKFNARLSKNNHAHYLAIAAGSGITPVISIIKHTLKNQSDSKFTLVYGNKNRNTIIFFEELEQLKNQYMGRFNFINVLSQEATDADIFHGRIQKEKLQSLSKIIGYAQLDAAYLCGPESMINDCTEFLVSTGLSASSIHVELFAASGTGKLAHNNTLVSATEGDLVSHVHINLDGRTFQFELGYNDKTVLDAALKQGADLPFACKGGVCCTCRAKLIEGKVRMDVNYSLEPEEIEQGFILTCQSHPITEKIVVDFDVR